MRRPLLLMVPLFLSAFHLAAQGPVRWWNTDISSAPVDPRSASFISFIGANRGMHPDFGGDSGDPSAPTYGMPYATVPGSQPLVPVVFDYDDESDYAAPGRPPGYPIPEQVKTEARWIEGGLAGNDARADGDRHMLIVDRDNRMLYELYALRWSGTRWEAGSGAIFLSTRARADAAGGEGRQALRSADLWSDQSAQVVRPEVTCSGLVPPARVGGGLCVAAGTVQPAEAGRYTEAEQAYVTPGGAIVFRFAPPHRARAVRH